MDERVLGLGVKLLMLAAVEFEAAAAVVVGFNNAISGFECHHQEKVPCF